ncbi:MAG: XdhC family protein [Candidatus Limnocylindrales bacterium]
MATTSLSILARAVELERAARPYAMATVVAVRRPTSARPGARGLIHPDGVVEGWVGGSCAQPIVVKEALRSMADGEPRLLRLSRDQPSDSRRGDGVIDYVMTCHSGGTLEIYVEPHLPAPQLWILGTTPIAHALVELGATSGYRVIVVDPVAQSEAFPAAAQVLQATDLRGLDASAPPYVVVASQGSWDEEAVAAALARDVAYVGLVASPTRAAAIREYLAGEGIAPERIAAVRAPAGLDLGAVTPTEVAVSILAELVEVRRGRADFVAAPGPATLTGAQAIVMAGAPAQAATGEGEIVLLDPVCGMTVERDLARHIAEHAGVVYAFCSVGCRARFVKDPGAYVGAATAHDDHADHAADEDHGGDHDHTDDSTHPRHADHPAS